MTRILLDTHLLIWSLIEPKRVPAAARVAIEDDRVMVLFSAASMWEIAIKSALGHADFGVSPSEIIRSALDAGLRELPVTSATAVKAADLPFHHRDPFDRLLVAQALAEPAYLYTADRVLMAYSDLVVAVR